MRNKVSDFLYEEESYTSRGACFSVFNALGGGIKENIIERALEQELKNKGFVVNRQTRIEIKYNEQKIGTYIPDIVINEKIMIELKSKPRLTREDKKQFWGYLKGSNYLLGFLVNFGTDKLTIERFAHSKKLSA